MTRGEGTASDQADGMSDGIHVRQTNSPLRLGGLAAFPFLVPSRTGRGSKAAKPQSLEGDGPQEGGAHDSRPVEFLEAAPAPESCVVAQGIRGLCAIRGSGI
jgi:hypothetical protein